MDKNINIQIFGTNKSQDTKKAIRFFKERNIKVHNIDLKEKQLSKREFLSVCEAIGGVEKIIDNKAKNQELITLLKYISKEDLSQKVFENQEALIQPIVRTAKSATVGYCPDVWKEWLK